MRVQRKSSRFVVGPCSNNNSQKVLMPVVKGILLGVVLISSQLIVSLNCVMASSVSSMESTAIFSVIKRSNAYVLPTSGITVVQTLFAQSLVHCSSLCNALQAGSVTIKCRGFIFTPRYCNQSLPGQENCQLVTFDNSTAVVLNEQNPGLECQRFFSLSSLWSNG